MTTSPVIDTQDTPERTAEVRAAALARDLREWEANEHDLPVNERFSRAPRRASATTQERV